MIRFPAGHAAHPQWRMACGLVLAQLRAQMALPAHASAPTLGLVYVTGHYVPHARALLDCLQAALPEVTAWTGAVGVGVCANNAEYIDEPALSVMLCDLPPDQYRVFSGVAPLSAARGFAPHSALIHADAQTPDLPDLIAEMAARTASGYLFGGLPASRCEALQFAFAADGNTPGQGAAGGVFSGGLSGVAFGAGVPIVSRVSQGCRPIAAERLITAAEGNVLLTLDGEPALDLLLDDLGICLKEPRQQRIDVVRQTLVGLSSHGDGGVRRHGHFGSDVVVRHIVGLDPGRRGVAIAGQPGNGQRAAFCRRDPQAARADLMRICAEIREELEPAEITGTTAALTAPHDESRARLAQPIRGAVYVSCGGRGGPYFGAPNAELQIVRHALGDVPLAGFFADGEIAWHHLYGYTGVLTVFVQE